MKATRVATVDVLETCARPVLQGGTTQRVQSCDALGAKPPLAARQGALQPVRHPGSR